MNNAVITKEQAAILRRLLKDGSWRHISYAAIEELRKLGVMIQREHGLHEPPYYSLTEKDRPPGQDSPKRAAELLLAYDQRKKESP